LVVAYFFGPPCS